ncbi:MAG: DUF2027 domain-containing protein [Bacteroidota bacterium]|nr:DUF2027 domain-containing protein [Bacteroidota bacterium]
MGLKVKDKVSFLNETGGGIITKLVDNETALVENEDGFEIPVLLSELILKKAWSPDLGQNKFTEEPQEKDVQEVKIEENPDIFYSDSSDVNIYMAFVPQNQDAPTSKGFDVYLINDSNYFLQYNLNYLYNGDFELFRGELEPNIKFFLTEIPRNTISDDFQMLFQCLFFDQKKFKLQAPLVKDLKIKASKLFKAGAYKPNDFFDELALIVPILEKNPMNEALEKLDNKSFAEKIKREKAPAKAERAIKKHKDEKKKSYKEVDLHIHELIDDETGLTDNDKREYQLDKFREEMDNALKGKEVKRIVFIHGVGSGRLKHDLRRELQRKYKTCLYQDASFAEYGYGATMVVVRR